MIRDVNKSRACFTFTLLVSAVSVPAKDRLEKSLFQERAEALARENELLRDQLPGHGTRWIASRRSLFRSNSADSGFRGKRKQRPNHRPIQRRSICHETSRTASGRGGDHRRPYLLSAVPAARISSVTRGSAQARSTQERPTAQAIRGGDSWLDQLQTRPVLPQR